MCGRGYQIYSEYVFSGHSGTTPVVYWKKQRDDASGSLKINGV